MFQLFCEEYKETVFRKARRKMKRYLRVLLVRPIAGELTLSLIFLHLPRPLWVTYLPLGVGKLLPQYKERYARILDRKQRITELSFLLQAHNPYPKEGIDRRCNGCGARKKENSLVHVFQTAEQFFVSTVFPVATLVIGIVLHDLSKTENVQDPLLILWIAFAGFPLFITVKNSTASFPEQTVLRNLKQDLGYIKSQTLR